MVELLAAGQRAPRDQLVHVGVAGVVRDRLALDAAPGRRADDLARLRLDVAEADLLVLAVQRQVRVVAAGLLAQRLPGLHRHVAVGLGRQLQDHLAGVDVGLDLRHAVGHALGGHQAVELAELLDLGLGVPGDALAAVADLVHQRAERGEALVDVRVVALDHLHVAARSCRGSARTRRASSPSRRRAAPARPGVSCISGVSTSSLLDAQVADADLAELLREALVDLPVAARLPGRVHRGGQRVDERVHVAGVEVVLLVPGRGRQHDVASTGRSCSCGSRASPAGRACLRAPCRARRLRCGLASSLPRSLPCTPLLVPSRCLRKYSWPLPLGAQDVGAPDEHVARPVVRVVGVGAAHLQRAVLAAP